MDANAALRAFSDGRVARNEHMQLQHIHAAELKRVLLALALLLLLQLDHRKFNVLLVSLHFVLGPEIGADSHQLFVEI